jgi:hypothetical protein
MTEIWQFGEEVELNILLDTLRKDHPTLKNLLRGSYSLKGSDINIESRNTM